MNYSRKLYSHIMNGGSVNSFYAKHTATGRANNSPSAVATRAVNARGVGRTSYQDIFTKPAFDPYVGPDSRR